MSTSTNKKKKLSLTYRFITRFGKHLDEDKYGDISIFKVLGYAIRLTFRFIILKYCLFSVLLISLNDRIIRPFLWRKLGAKVGKKVTIGYNVMVDIGNTHMVTVEDYVTITDKCLLICHKRDLSNITVGVDYRELPHLKLPIVLKKGSYLGMGTTVMPGVTIGEGAMIGACSVVTKDIPAWTIAVGNPAKVVKKIPQVEHQNN